MKPPPAWVGAEDPAYLRGQLITCIGNKRALLAPIAAAVERVRARLGGRRLRALDAFSGSGVVSRLLKAHCDLLVSNDLEEYAAAAGRSFLRNRSQVDLGALAERCAVLNTAADEAVGDAVGPPGFIEELYAPRDEARIRPGERVFYTRANARRLDLLRRRLAALPVAEEELLLGPLLGAASVHANTAGVFKSFYKDRASGCGRLGGRGGDALPRITGTIALAPPRLSRFESDVRVLCGDALLAARELRGLDLAYLDPPYNQHPYGSNYFMLNLLARYRRPERISPVAGIPADWRRSRFNKRAEALPALAELLAALDAPFLLLSYNDEGFLPPPAMERLLTGLGRVSVVESPYSTFRGSRNLGGRRLRVVERLYLVERSG
jgi:adenine-specific DNA-methyltransferase